MIAIKGGHGPFVIDRKLPSALFQRVPWHYDLLAVETKSGSEPMSFKTPGEAEAFLRENLDEDGIAAYEWVVFPEADLSPRAGKVGVG